MSNKKQDGFRLQREQRVVKVNPERVLHSKSSLALLVGIGLSMGMIQSCEPMSGDVTAPSVESSATQASSEERLPDGQPDLSSDTHISSSEPISGSSTTEIPLSHSEPTAGIVSPPSSTTEIPHTSSEPIGGSSTTEFEMEPESGVIVVQPSSSVQIGSSSNTQSSDALSSSANDVSSSSSIEEPLAGAPIINFDDSLLYIKVDREPIGGLYVDDTPIDVEKIKEQ